MPQFGRHPKERHESASKLNAHEAPPLPDGARETGSDPFSLGGEGAGSELAEVRRADEGVRPRRVRSTSVERTRSSPGTTNPVRYSRVSIVSASESLTNDSVDGLMCSLRPSR